MGNKAANLKELLNGKGAETCLLSSVRIEVEVEEIGQEEVETAMRNMKKGNATGADGVRLEMLEMAGGGSQVDRKATELVYAGGKDTEGVEDGPDSADMEEDRGCA